MRYLLALLPMLLASCIATPSDYAQWRQQALDVDDDGYLPLSEGGLDCSDNNDAVYPGAPELCDGLDNNCNGLVDEGWYVDADGDGYTSTHDQGLCLPGRAASQEPGDDCDDASAEIHPGAAPDCDGGVDLNCNGIDDSEDPADTDLDGYPDCDGDCAPMDPAAPWASWPDADSDGFGNQDVDFVLHCEPVDGYVDNGDDCNDQNDALHPNTRWYLDEDGDGFGTEAYITQCEAPDGYARYAGDCDDGDTAFYPGAPEDDCTDPNDYNCDGSTGYADGDGDGWPACEECDDTDATINPDGTEVCDDADNNCNGVIDEDTAVDAPTWYADTDQDTYGDLSNTTVACEAPTGFVADSKDCDDGNKDVNPGAQEVCDEQDTDEDCDGASDDDDTSATGQTRWFSDTDADTYGDAASYTDLCEQPSSTVTDNTDCDDTDDTVYPGANELCDGQDNDCDNSLWSDEEDDDSDGYVPCAEDGGGWDDGAAPGYEDCDDTDDTVHPSAPELCDGQDNDCDASLPNDETDNDGDGAVECSEDADGWDGTSSVDFEDCDDTDDTVYVGASELCDGQDNDCDSALPADESDDDSDGYVECSEDSGGWDGTSTPGFEDCDDTNGDVNPGATETVGDGVDDDCDDTLTCYVDVDGDGFGDDDVTQTTTVSTSTSTTCDVSASGLADDATDCDDGNASSYPSAPELCDGQDNDCDSAVPADETDGDSDGYVECTPIATWSQDGGDCDDTDGDVNPGATEVVGDDVDDDCDNALTCYDDTDGDGQGEDLGSANPTTTGSTCDASTSGLADDDDDCDDTDNAVYLGASEVTADGVDQDCDGVDTCYLDGDQDGYGSTSLTESTSLVCDDRTNKLADDDDDCDDGDGDVNPSATEVVGDDVDDDCDNALTCYDDTDGDGQGEDLGSGNPTTTGSTCDVSTSGLADDDDDCDDTDSDVFLGATETVGDDVDDDCDGDLTCHRDGDGDGYGHLTKTATTSGSTCDDAANSVADDATDCRDGNASIHPGATEVVDTSDRDENCDGVLLCYVDSDSDGYGTDAGTTTSTTGSTCDDASSGLSQTQDDCDDTLSAVNPGGQEVCDVDDTDEDCDGDIDDDDSSVATSTQSTWYIDFDDDGYGDGSRADVGEYCDEPSNTTLTGDYATDNTDCNDTDSSVNPGATEVCDDGIDNDCDSNTGAPTCLLDSSYDLSTDADLTFTVGTLETAAMSTDMTSDGLGDLLVLDSSTSTIYLLAGPLTADGAISATATHYSASLTTNGTTMAVGYWDSGAVEDVATPGNVHLNGGTLGPTLPNAAVTTLTTVTGGASVFVDRSTPGIAYGNTNAINIYDTQVVGLCAPDLNHDGAADGVFDGGYVTFGPITASFNAAVHNDRAYTSFDVCDSGDLNGDGGDDLLAGYAGWTDSTAGTTPGAAWVVDGSATSLPFATSIDSVGYRLSSSDNSDDGSEIGYDVAVVTDMNGDGYDEALIGAPGTDSNAGAVYLFYGPITADVSVSSADVVLEGATNDELGDTVEGRADLIAGDGTIDLMLTAPGNDTVYILQGTGI